ncbi:ATP-binding protein [Pseudodesulfovibrio tunisiensis]|uniref:ATP-binding protein n=1 Tax=Pseudodesulfovibrio tunisiensis TaxID=463192 RepID=UPI001FB2342B|nr:ATP-binding protein [Pseudodesulfovibrio tunisiensis]
MSRMHGIKDRFHRIALRNKLMASMLLAVMFISVAIAFVARGILVTSLTSELEMRGSAIAHSVAERGGSYILDHKMPQLLALIFDEARLQQRKHLVSYIFVEDQNSRVLAHTMTRRLPSILLAHKIPAGSNKSVKKLSVEGEPVLDIAVAINEGLYRVGVVHVGLNQKHIDSLVGKLRTAFLGFISLVIIITAFLSSWVTSNITQPVADLTRIADQISRGNFDIPSTLGSQDDWDTSQCPAYHDTDLPCWHLDQSLGREGNPRPLHRTCAKCMFYRKREGDEVVQLTDAFRNMVWSIKLYRHRLRESEEKYRSLFDSGPDPIFVVGCEGGRIKDANPRAVELYGYSRRELVGMPFVSLGPEHNTQCLEYFHDGEGHGCVYYPKLMHYKKGGKPFFVNMHACPISYRGHHAIIIAVADITEVIEKDAQVIQAGKMKSLGEMSAGIAHEINQPLNAIKMGSEFLCMMSEQGVAVPKAEYEEVVREISVQVDRASEIINTLRAFGRKSDLIAEKADLNRAVRAALSILKRQFELDDIRFGLEFTEPLASVVAHENRLQQVFFNLVTNARDAIDDVSRPGQEGAERTIFIRTGQEHGHVFAEVADSGGGISEEARSRIFEPFYTTKETGQGMGLGLAITYGIVKDYGGTIDIGDRKGGGAVFRVEFPAADK